MVTKSNWDMNAKIEKQLKWSILRSDRLYLKETPVLILKENQWDPKKVDRLDALPPKPPNGKKGKKWRNGGTSTSKPTKTSIFPSVILFLISTI